MIVEKSLEFIGSAGLAFLMCVILRQTSLFPKGRTLAHVSHMRSASGLFPGQVVQVTGRNPAGHCLVVKSIDAAPAVRPFARSKRSSPAFTRGAKVLVASGPFSCSSDLRYEPLGDFLEYARDEKPDVVVDLCESLAAYG